MADLRFWERCVRFSLCALFLCCGFLSVADAQEDVVPSLELPPPEQAVPERKGTPPVQPLAVFQEIIGGFGIADGSFDMPVDVAADGNGNIYVLDVNNSRVQKFTGNERFDLEWGEFGSREGAFNDPRAIALDGEGFVYVVDTENHRIQKFTPEGEFVMTWGSLGSHTGNFNGPTDITFDDEGNIFVLDAGNERVQKFTAAAAFVEEWGRFKGGREGSFTDLVSLAWADDRFGYLYLLGKGSCQVQQLDLSSLRGDVIQTWDAADPSVDECDPARIEIDNKNDYIYVLDKENSILVRLTKDGEFLASVEGGEEPFNEPMGFTIDPGSEQVWVADTGNNVIQKFTLRGGSFR